MPTPPTRAAISGTPSRAAANAGFGALWDYVTGLLGSTGNAAEARTALDVPSRTGANSSGTWPIAISGNAATATAATTATTATNCTRSVVAGGLVTGGGALSADRTVTVTAATQAQAEAGTATNVALTPLALRQGLNATGAAPVYACRAWVNFNGTGTVAIRASGNVSSITDNGVGDYAVNFSSAMPDANYAASGAASGVSRDVLISFGDDDGPAQPVSFSASSLRIYVQNGSGVLVDPAVASVSFFR